MARDAELRKIVSDLLDHCDRAGRFPRKMVFRCKHRTEREALVRLLSVNAVRADPADPLLLRLDLGKVDDDLREDGAPSLKDLLYAAAGRAPRDLRAEKSEVAARAGESVLSLAGAAEGAARSFLLDAAARLSGARGELFRSAWENGIEGVVGELDAAARCIAAAGSNDGPVRLADFSRRATGTTKGIRAGDARYVLVADALLRFHPGIHDRVEAESPGNHPDRRRLALEILGIFRNETPIDALCFGNFALAKGGVLLEDPSAHFALGEPVRLLLLHLRDARIARMRTTRIVSIENETTFNDYVDRQKETGGEEIVLCSQGQANWAVVRLLRLLHEADPAVPVFHWGDLDRSGVLILRSLRRRSGVPVEPLWMDPGTLRRFSSEGIPLSREEREEIDRLLGKRAEEPGNDLLAALRDIGKWVEQETVADGIAGWEGG